MKSIKLKLRCYALQDKKEGYWIASCIDLCLAVQGETLEEVTNKLKFMIHEYINDAILGEHKKYAEQLLTRKAPWQEFVRYYYYKFLNSINFSSANHKSFQEDFVAI